MANSNVTIRIDDDLKREADDLFGELGISLSGAVNLFLRQCIRDGGLPFVPTTRSTSAKHMHVEYAFSDLSKSNSHKENREGSSAENDSAKND